MVTHIYILIYKIINVRIRFEWCLCHWRAIRVRAFHLIFTIFGIVLPLFDGVVYVELANFISID